MNAKRRVVWFVGAVCMILPLSLGQAEESREGHFKERIAALEEKLQDAKAAGKEEAARELAAQLEQVRREAKQAAATAETEKEKPKKEAPAKETPVKETPKKETPKKETAETEKPKKALPGQSGAEGRERPPVPEELAQRMEQARRKIEELRASGKLDEARAMAEELERAMQRWRTQAELAGRERRPEGGPESPERRALEARRQALMMAAEQLAAAGLQDQAEMMRRQANELEAIRRRELENRETIAAPVRELHEKMHGLNERIERLEQAMQKVTRVLEEIAIQVKSATPAAP